MNNWKTYKNGNYIININLLDGTKIRMTKDDDFIPSFAENMDIKITDYCDRNCKYCFEGSNINGKHADILNEKFINTLHPYQEVALGGGDVTSHPDLIPFLYKLKELKVITNITINQIHFEQKEKIIKELIRNKLIYGLGVSLVNPTEKFITKIKQYPNAVIHVINGILTSSDIDLLSNHDLKILILGYKQLRRGNEWFNKDYNNIKNNQLWLKNNLKDILKKFKVVSFDNLAIEQLQVHNILTDKSWDSFYMGDDGNFTYYIDMVNRKYAKSSTADFDKRYNLLNSVDDMFVNIRNER